MKIFQEKLSSLRPYVSGIRFVKDLPVVDLILRDGWDIFESETVTYKNSANNDLYFMLFPKSQDDTIDTILDHAEHIINYNIEKENKLVL